MSNIITQRFISCHNKLKEEARVRSSRQFALSLDYLPQSLSEILKGRRDVTIDLLRKAVETYKFNPVYLCTGEGPMFMTEESRDNFRMLTIVTSPDDDERIVHVPVPAQVGYAAEMSNPSFIEELPTYTLPDYKYKTGTHRSFDVAGDSMEPTLFEGDKVVASFVESTEWETAIKDNYVYVVVTRSDILVKRVENKIKAEQQLTLYSDNDFYQPFTVRLGDVREIWYVRARISPFLPAPNRIHGHLRDEISDLKKTVLAQTELINKLNLLLERLV